MKILLDECVPRPFKHALTGENRECLTASEAGFTGKKNSELLKLAEPAFDVFVTVDQGFQYQQNLTARRLAIILVHSRSNRFSDLRQHVPAVSQTLNSIQPGQLVQIGD
jgi:predicted nuclease of predicted toxin-antitoxin system